MSVRPASLGLAGALGLALAAACSPAVEPAPAAPAQSAAAAPEPVNGWIELPLPEGVAKRHDALWRTDTVSIPAPAGDDLEYKRAMAKGDVALYAIRFPEGAHPGLFVMEFHGHTEKRADGIGDLMFYSVAAGVPETGSLTAPFDGVHGWYLKNEGPDEAVVTLEIAGWYEIIGY
jgi:hypothetical protein